MCARFSLEIASTASQIYSGGIYLGWDGFVSVSLHPKYFWIIKNIWFGSTGFTASKKRIFVIVIGCTGKYLGQLTCLFEYCENIFWAASQFHSLLFQEEQILSSLWWWWRWNLFQFCGKWWCWRQWLIWKSDSFQLSSKYKFFPWFSLPIFSPRYNDITI